MNGSIREIVAAEGRREQILQPSWSFDGRMFVYLKSSTRSGHEIWVKNIESGEDILVERVPIGRGACGNPVWFNRHQKVLYLKFRRIKNRWQHIEELWIFDVGTKQKKKIYEGRIATVFVSPDDNLIGADIGNYFSLFDINGNFIKNLEPGSSIKPSWSPDGLYIAYLKGKVNPVTEISINRHIHAININTGIDKDLTPVPGLEVDEFRWLNDNTVVY